MKYTKEIDKCEHVIRGTAANHDQRLHLSQKLYQRSIYPEVRRVASGGVLRRPLVIELDPTSACDFSCPECISRGLLNQGGFTSERLVELAQEIVDVKVKAVILIGGGEPLMHPAAGQVVRLLAEGGVAVGVTTDGTAIDRHLQVLSDHAAWVRVSVDAATAAIHAKTRPHRTGRSMFGKVIENMRHLARSKKGALGFSFLLITRMADDGEVLHTNVGEVLAAGQLAREMGCDYFEVKPFYDMRHFLIPQPAHLVEELKNQMAELNELADGNFQVLFPTNLDVILRHEPTVEPKRYSLCPVSELRTLITPKGAYICPYFRGDQSRRYGDPLKDSIESMWNGRERRLVMQATRPCQDCQFHCIRHPSNREILQMGQQPVPISLVSDFDAFI